jgi:hypothetical protein
MQQMLNLLLPIIYTVVGHLMAAILAKLGLVSCDQKQGLRHVGPALLQDSFNE